MVVHLGFPIKKWIDSYKIFLLLITGFLRSFITLKNKTNNVKKLGINKSDQVEPAKKTS
ncbi:hypothetical protein EVI01_21250 [Enterococcus villorum]|uniref:Uncharacterized protein n=1 Tax=Enterococcus villorum TaxID=112904 RepID=A0A511J447_9ENTE|nr:hypothetical protein EVI01_21250 [Enterococcus villorum]